METWGTLDKNGQTRDSGNMGYTRQERTQETVETWGTQDQKGQTRDSRNMGYTRQERTNQRQWKHGVHKTQDKKNDEQHDHHQKRRYLRRLHSSCFLKDTCYVTHIVKTCLTTLCANKHN